MIKRRILDLVDAQDGIERAAFALMREFHAIDVIRNPARLSGNSEDLILRDVDELCIGIDEAADQPGTGDAVDLRVLARHPLARSYPDVAARGQSPLNPIGNAAFQKVRLDPHEAQCGSYALADLLAVNAVCDDLAAVRQNVSPLFHII